MTPMRKAFTLVEMMAAVVIFGISVVAGLEAITACLRSTDNARSHTQATFLAQGLMEEALAETAPIPGEESGTFEEPFGAFEWTREVAETDTPGLYSVWVEVSWTDRGRPRSCELMTLQADR